MSRWLARPPWWPKWVPVRCPGCGSPLLPGRVSRGWTACDCREDSQPGKPAGHERWHCQTPGCGWWTFPPEHVEDAKAAD